MFDFLRTPKTITHLVQDKPVKFQAAPVGTLVKVRNLVEGNKAVAKLTAYFFVDKSKDTEVTTQKEVTDAEKGLYKETTNISEVSPNIAAMRQRDLENGLEGITSLLTSSESMDLLSEIIFHSAVEGWKAKSVPLAEAKVEILALGPDVFMDFIIGCVKANKGVLNSLGKLFPQMKDLEAKIEERMES